MICTSCQAENDAAAETCHGCGKPLLGIGPGSMVAGRYEILDAVGEGGMGMVYKAHDQVLDEVVALKMLRPTFARTPELGRRFRSEIKLARKVSHRNVCRIHEYGEDGNLRYICMEFVDGTNLKEAVRGKGGLPPEEARELAMQIAKGLQAIHDVGVIHRDLKTANIMKDKRGVVRLMDFGIAKQYGEEAGEGLTGVGDIVGTPEYMSPEQARGMSLDFRSDIYSMGVVLYEILTGRLPFRGQSPVDTLLKHVQEPPPLEGIPAPFLPILQKALAKEPVERYATARGLAADLRLAGPSPAVVAPAPTPLESISGLREAREESDILGKEVASLLRGLGEPVDPAVQERVRALIPALKDANPTARWRTAVTLFRIGPAAKEAVPALTAALRDATRSVAEAAAEALKRITGQAVLPEPEPPAPTTAVLNLIAALRSDDSFVRWRSTLALGEMGAGAVEATAALIDELDDKDDNVRWAAAAALGKIGPAAREAVPALAAALADAQDDVMRQHAARALGQMGLAARDAVPGLIGALRGKDTAVRDEVVEALVKVGAAAVPALIEALQDDDERVRFESANALTRIGTALKPAS